MQNGAMAGGDRMPREHRHQYRARQSDTEADSKGTERRTLFLVAVCSVRTSIATLGIRPFTALRVKAFLGGDVFSAVQCFSAGSGDERMRSGLL
jgi:hypothetical protein